MLVSKRNLEVEVTSTDKTRGTLQGIHFDNGSSVSCDGHILLLVPYPDESDQDYPKVLDLKPDPQVWPKYPNFHFPDRTPEITRPFKPFTVSLDGAKRIAKNVLKERECRGLPILQNALLDTVQTDNNGSAIFGTTDLTSPQKIEIRKLDDPYPDYRAVIPPDGLVEYRISLRIAVLKKLVRALEKGLDSRGKDTAYITFGFTGRQHAIKIECRDITGVVMPVRTED